MSIAYLEAKQLFIGLQLTTFVLLYTLCNQYLFKKRFPKEFFVALLYAYGVFFLIEPKITNKELYLFASVCLLNCLLISKKESSIDRLNEMRSIGLFERFRYAISNTLIFYNVLFTQSSSKYLLIY